MRSSSRPYIKYHGTHSPPSQQKTIDWHCHTLPNTTWVVHSHPSQLTALNKDTTPIQWQRHSLTFLSPFSFMLKIIFIEAAEDCYSCSANFFEYFLMNWKIKFISYLCCRCNGSNIQPGSTHWYDVNWHSACILCCRNMCPCFKVSTDMFVHYINVVVDIVNRQFRIMPPTYFGYQCIYI